MQIVLSPAKLMDFDGADDSVKATDPLFTDKTAELVAVCREMSIDEIAASMNINPQMAHDVFGYFQTFDLPVAPRRAAALAYNGIAYKGLNAYDFSADDFTFAQQHLNILSGLYGIIRPMDAIRPYRLEFQRKIVPEGYKSLYDFWGDTLNAYLASKLMHDERVIINVASQEYGKVVRKNKLPQGTRIIDIRFLQHETNGFRQVVVHAKKARGLMARFIIKNRLTKYQDVQAFDSEGYFFYPDLSKEDEWVFVR